MRERRKSGGGPEHHLQDEEGPSRISFLIFLAKKSDDITQEEAGLAAEGGVAWRRRA